MTECSDTRELGANKDADDIRNWVFAKLIQTLETRIPVLETNGHPGWEPVKELAQATRSRVGFRGRQFRLEPSVAQTAKIKTAITDAATSLPLKDFSTVNVPSRGTVSVEGELIAYTGLSSGTLTGLIRGAFETTADGHLVDAQVVFVDHIVDEYLSLNLSNDPSRIKNDIKIHYGNDQVSLIKMMRRSRRLEGMNWICGFRWDRSRQHGQSHWRKGISRISKIRKRWFR